MLNPDVYVKKIAGVRYVFDADGNDVTAQWESPHQQSERPKLPSFPAQVHSLGVAVWEHMRSGFKNVASKEYARRIAICDDCEVGGEKSLVAEKHLSVTIERCLVCGCAMKIKAKWETEHCKLGKW